ncbi:integral membrane protein [Fusarium beomiforme]|uniref:Integral membrane protein n=1 Tax=Fusarium beomiforme TaxID=44412 RepID=A0A9P5DYB6_9HYPO|nr:integral membrane protein [Fusarium beomiforme]
MADPKHYTPDAGVMSSQIITYSVATTLVTAASLYFGFTMYCHLKADVPLPAEEVEEYARFGLFIAEFTYAMSLGFSKLAILGFYWRLFSVSNIRMGIYILQGATVIWLTIRTFMTIFHCVPTAAYWDLNIKNAVCNINPAKFMFGTTLVHLFLEIAVLSLPVFQVKNLKLRPGQKIAVVAMFMFGIFVCVASVIVLIEAERLNPKTTEMARDIRGVIIWAGTEAYLAIISSCLPIIRPIFRKFISSSILSSKSNSTGPNPISGLTSSRGIKLTNVTRTKEIDDNSSQRQLAELEDGSSDDMNFHGYTERGGTRANHNTVITSCADERPNSHTHNPSLQGIQVKNETRVYYE